MVDSEIITATQCYNISVNFQDEGFCDLFGQSCDSVDLPIHLSKSNKSDPVSIIGETAQVVVDVSDQCKCSDNKTITPTVKPTVTQSHRGSENDIVIITSVLSVAVAIVIAAVMVMIIFYYRKKRNLVTNNNTEE